MRILFKEVCSLIVFLQLITINSVNAENLYCEDNPCYQESGMPFKKYKFFCLDSDGFIFKHTEGSSKIHPKNWKSLQEFYDSENVCGGGLRSHEYTHISKRERFVRSDSGLSLPKIFSSSDENINTNTSRLSKSEEITNVVFTSYGNTLQKYSTFNLGRKISGWVNKFQGKPITPELKNVHLSTNHYTIIKNLVEKTIEANSKYRVLTFDDFFDSTGMGIPSWGLIVYQSTKAQYNFDEGQRSLTSCQLVPGQIVHPIRLSHGADAIDEVIVQVIQSDLSIENENTCQVNDQIRLNLSYFSDMLTNLQIRISDAMN